MRSSNPALSDKTFSKLFAQPQEQKMTIQGTVNKSFMLIAIVVVAAMFSWMQAYPSGWSADAVPTAPGWYIPVIIASLILSFVIIFKPKTAPLLAPVYAILQGLMLGAVSALFEARFPGIVLQAVLCTLGTFVGLLLAYKSGLIKATQNFILGVSAATMGICLVYLLDFGLGLAGIRVPYLHENGMVGIGISLFITVIAALNLVLDFDFIEKGAEQGAPQYVEWYAAFGLLVTLIWLYLEMLRLLGKARSK